MRHQFLSSLWDWRFHIWSQGKNLCRLRIHKKLMFIAMFAEQIPTPGDLATLGCGRLCIPLLGATLRDCSMVNTECCWSFKLKPLVVGGCNTKKKHQNLCYGEFQLPFSSNAKLGLKIPTQLINTRGAGKFLQFKNSWTPTIDKPTDLSTSPLEILFFLH